MTERNELIIKFTTAPGTVDENIASVKSQVESWLEDFNDLENMTDDQIPELKKRLADLRNGKKIIEDERKRIKKEYLNPLDDFEKKVKTITVQIDDCISTGKKRLDEYEAKKNAEKKAMIETWWIQHRPIPMMSFEAVWQESFLNKTGDGARWEQILIWKIKDIERDLKLIAADIMNDKERGNFISADYMQTLDYMTSVANWNAKVAKEEADRKRAEESARYNEELRKAREEAERKDRDEAEKRALEAARIQAEQEAKAALERSQAAEQPLQDAKFYTLTFRMVNIPEEKVRSLNNTIRALGIRITVMENEVTDQDGELLKRIVKDKEGNEIERWVKEEGK